MTEAELLGREELFRAISEAGANAAVMEMVKTMDDDTLRAFHATVCRPSTPPGAEWVGVVVECISTDDDDDCENIAVLNDLPREWIGRRVRVTLAPPA